MHSLYVTNSSLFYKRRITHPIQKYSSSFMFFRKPHYQVITNHISDIQFSKINEQPAEPSAEETINTKTVISHAQDCVMDPTQAEETSKIESLATWSHKNNMETHEDLHTNMTLIHTIFTLLHDIFTKLKEVTKLQHRNPSEILYHNLSQQLHSLSQQVDRMQQSLPQDNKLRKSKNRKPETRICFKCNKFGHIARKCRSRPLQRPQYQQTRQQISFRKQRFTQNPHYLASRNKSDNPSTNHTSDNRQQSTLRSKQTSPQNIVTPPHQHNITSLEVLDSGSSLSHDSSQETNLKTKKNPEDWTYYYPTL